MKKAKLKFKTILGIETSCDETGCSITSIENNRVIIKSNIISSSLELQANFGGVMPEQAAREQLKFIIPCVSQSLKQAKINLNQIDAIAVTVGPGLIGSLLVGVETAKTLASIYQKPIIPINHLMAHFYANWIEDRSWKSVDGSQKLVVSSQESSKSKLPATNYLPTFPTIGLLVSGGHTDLILLKGHGDYDYLGGTLDDAAGECFDKCARLLGLSYPGGPALAKLALEGEANKYTLPKPMINSSSLDFSFSGLKTAVLYLINKITKEQDHELDDQQRADIALAVEDSIAKVLVKKAIKAAQICKVDQIIISGGVAANQRLRSELQFQIKNLSREAKVFIPSTLFCTDNGAVISACALFNPHPSGLLSIQANPNLSLKK